MIEPESLKQLISAALPGAEVRVSDLTGTRDHYEGVVIAASFEGKSLLEQHRMVYAALGPAMGREVHAFTFKTYTPDAWAKARAEEGGHSDA